MNNRSIIEHFYTSFQNKDWNSMQSCYHTDIHFSDPVFQNLKGKQAKAMWHMLIIASTDLTIKFGDNEVDGQKGVCQWEAFYSFTRTGREVHNQIKASFEFKDGLIIRHEDSFDLWKWSRMALGTSGLLLGWTSFMKGKIRRMANQNLSNFIAKNPTYL